MLSSRRHIITGTAGDPAVVERSEVTTSGEVVDARARLVNGIANVVYTITWIVSIIIIIRFALLMAGGNQQNEFFQFVLGLSHPFMAPFVSLFGNTPSVPHGVFEWTALVALAVYWLLANIVVSVADAMIHPNWGTTAYHEHRSSQSTLP